MICSVDFADLRAGVFGCVRAGGAHASAAWLSTSGELNAVSSTGEAPSLALAAGDQLELELEPLLGPVELPANGREWICRATGRAGGGELDGLARIARAEPGAVRAGQLPLRSISAWVDPELAVICRAAGADPERGQLQAWVLRAGAAPAPVEDPRLSTAYAADGTHERAGIELWEGEESEFPLRLAGERVAHVRLIQGALQLDCAFMRWECEGRVGAGCYELASSAP